MPPEKLIDGEESVRAMYDLVKSPNCVEYSLQNQILTSYTNKDDPVTSIPVNNNNGTVRQETISNSNNTTPPFLVLNEQISGLSPFHSNRKIDESYAQIQNSFYNFTRNDELE